MNIGDYVRTKSGDIFKYVETDKNGKLRRTLSSDNENITTGFELSDVIKSSPNIIDLIEEGDYVNGNKVLEKEDYLLWVFDNDKHDTLYFSDEDIKSIVTKEQFESMEYRIGE